MSPTLQNSLIFKRFCYCCTFEPVKHAVIMVGCQEIQLKVFILRSVDVEKKNDFMKPPKLS